MTENTAAAKATATAAIRRCRCGCEAPLGGKAAYRPGHDARHVSNLKKRLDVAEQLSRRTPEENERIQAEVYAIFAELKTTALRQKLGRAVDNDKEGLYNSFGDAGIYVPYSDNPSLGRRHEQTDLQTKFEAAHPVEEAKARKVKDSAPAVADEPWITHEPVEEDETPAVPEPMWTETTQDETPLEVKIGRWIYPARRTEAGLERNTKRDGSGEWVEADVMDLFRS